MTLEELTQAISAKKSECDLACQQLQKDYLAEQMERGECFTIGDVIEHSRLGHKIEIRKVKYDILHSAVEFLNYREDSDWEPSIDYNGKLLDDKLLPTEYESILRIPHRRAVLVKKGAYNGPVFISK